MFNEVGCPDDQGSMQGSPETSFAGQNFHPTYPRITTTGLINNESIAFEMLYAALVTPLLLSNEINKLVILYRATTRLVLDLCGLTY